MPIVRFATFAAPADIAKRAIRVLQCHCTWTTPAKSKLKGEIIMVALIMGITTLINVVLIPAIAGVFGRWITGGLDAGSIVETITGFLGKLF